MLHIGEAPQACACGAAFIHNTNTRTQLTTLALQHVPQVRQLTELHPLIEAPLASAEERHDGKVTNSNCAGGMYNCICDSVMCHLDLLAHMTGQPC